MTTVGSPGKSFQWGTWSIQLCCEVAKFGEKFQFEIGGLDGNKHCGNDWEWNGLS